MAALYPRLQPVEAQQLWDQYRDFSIEELRTRSSRAHRAQIFAAVGGRRITDDELRAIQYRIREIAAAAGYPSGQSRVGYAQFDIETAIYLGSELEIAEGEALRPETWAFMSLVLLPDVVKWRFDNFPASRCTGGRRDCFQRLWLRATAFDLGSTSSDRWALLKGLTEDAFVSILERPTLAGNSDICRAIGRTWMRIAAEIGRREMESVNRDAVKWIRARATVLLLDALEYGALESLFESCYRTAIGAGHRSQRCHSGQEFLP